MAERSAISAISTMEDDVGNSKIDEDVNKLADCNKSNYGNDRDEVVINEVELKVMMNEKILETKAVKIKQETNSAFFKNESKSFPTKK